MPNNREMNIFAMYIYKTENNKTKLKSKFILFYDLFLFWIKLSIEQN